MADDAVCCEPLSTTNSLTQDADNEILRARQLLAAKSAVERDALMLGNLNFPSGDASNGRAHGSPQYVQDLRIITDAMGATVTWCGRSLRYIWVKPRI